MATNGAARKKAKPRTKSPLTEQAVALRKKAVELRAKADETHNADEEAAALKAEKEADVATRKDNRARFERVAGGRASQALISLKALAGIAARGKYLYNADDVETMFKEITSAVDDAKLAFTRALELEVLQSPKKKKRVTFAPMAL